MRSKKKTDEWLKKAGDYWASWEKEIKDKEKFGFAHAADIKKKSPETMAKLEEATKTSQTLTSFKSGMPWWTNPLLRWPKGRIYFCIEGGLSEYMIRKGFRVAFKGTHITYMQVKCNNPNYKIIFKKVVVNAQQEASSGFITLGSSDVGYWKEFDAADRARGGQELFIRKQSTGTAKDPNDANYRTVAHELLHALGFSHTHQRVVRDKFVKVDQAKVTADPANCGKDGPPKWTEGGKYDYTSIMHYNAGVCGLAKKNDITEGDKDNSIGYDNNVATWGNVNAPSANDIALINGLYPPAFCR